MKVETFIDNESIRVWVRFRRRVAGQPSNRPLEDPNLPVTVYIDPPPGNPMPPTRVIEATRFSAGVFYADTIGDIPGWWTARGESAQPGAGIDEGVFEVKASRIRS